MSCCHAVKVTEVMLSSALTVCWDAVCLCLLDVGPSFDVADSEAVSTGSSAAISSTAGSPHQILEFFEMCCSLITTLAK